MLHWKSFSRVFLLFALLISLLAGVSAPAFVNEHVSAAPKSLVSVGDVVISEFRFLGPAGGDDEFIELYNPKNIPVNITGLKIMGSNNSAGIGQRALLGSVTLQAGQHYLLVNSAASAGLKALNDATYPTGLTEDGGIALIDGTTNITIDAVGLSTGSAYKEGTPLTPLVAGTVEQSYERRDNGCTDTDNNSTDFVWNQNSSNPQNSTTIPVSCLRVTNVLAPGADGTHTTTLNPIISIEIIFSNNVTVTGTPRLSLETGATDRSASYVSGSGTNTLTFTYTVQTNHVSGDLDYVDTNSLSLNGGSIVGAVGNANLTLPGLGSIGSLGINNAIIIDNGIDPSIISFKRQLPLAATTNLDSLTFRASFSEPVIGVDSSDFSVSGATGTTISVISVTGGSVYDVTASGGTLISFNGDVGLDLSGTQNITDAVNSPLLSPLPTVDEVYSVDNVAPKVVVTRDPGQSSTASGIPVNFIVQFNDIIDVNTFTVASITQTGIAPYLVTWSITDSGDHMKFALSAIAVAANGTLHPSISTGVVKDLAGNAVIDITSTESVIFTDTDPPTVTVNKAVGQPDPTAAFPIKFAVVFSEPIIASIFTPSDITQQTGTGMATGITWSIADSGDHKNFTLSATAVSGPGTLSPSIAANRVTDLVGNNNTASTTPSGGDGTVIYENVSPTVTINQASGQIDPTSALPVNFTVTFSEPIDSITFTKADITQLGTATGVNWSIGNSVDGRVFPLSAVNMNTNGTLKPYLPANLVKDIAGNNNFASTSTDNTVTYTGKISTPAPTNTPTPTTTPTLNLIINEVAWMGTKASTADEWIELYNPGGTVDLTGWKLSITNSSSGNSVTINLIGSIPAGGYFVLASNSTVFRDLTPQMTFSNSLSNDGEIMKLLNPGDVIVDTANHDGGGWPAGSTSTFSSMERVGRSNETPGTWATFASTLVVAHDKNNNDIKGTPGQANWTTLVTLTPSPTRTPTFRVTPIRTPTPVIRLSGRPIISEFLARPGFDWNQDGKVDVFDEFIEVKNAGPVEISLSGWKLDDESNLGSAIFTLPAVTLKPGERAVFYGLATNILLGDGGDSVRLLNPSGQVYDSYTYAVAKVEDQSTCRLPDVSGNEFGFGEWYTDCVPTPNLTNTRQGTAPSMPGGEAFEPTTCDLPDTLPADFLFAECRGYGTNIWSTFYWDQPGWQGEQYVPENMSKWESFVK